MKKLLTLLLLPFTVITSMSACQTVRASDSYNDPVSDTAPRYDAQNLHTLEFPYFTAGTPLEPCDIGHGNTLFVYTNTDEAAYADYCALLVKGGYEKKYDNTITDNRFAAFSGEDRTLYAYYIPSQQSVRIVDDPTSDGLAVFTEERKGDKVTDNHVAQLIMNYSWQDFGMCYIFTLEDGRFVIIDGGYDAGKDFSGYVHDLIYNYLNEHNLRSDGIHIAAWILTHDHPDHYNAIHGFAEKYGSEVAVERFLMNLRKDSDYERNVWEADRSAFGADMLVQYLHTGEKFSFCGIEFEVLYTQEDLYPVDPEGDINETSIVLRSTAEGQSFLWCSDIEERACGVICPMYGSYLQSEVCQIAHHGYLEHAATTEFYDLADPSVILWPHSIGCMQAWSSSAVNQHLLNEQNVKEVLIADRTIKVLPLPYQGEFTCLSIPFRPNMPTTPVVKDEKQDPSVIHYSRNSHNG